MAAVSGYDAFLSYSHQRDDVLGPALQAELERFAKPWYRLRALRIFRDTANLGANPALWASIEEGLQSSRWFILLASRDSAKSAWVNREVGWWVDHRAPDRLLVVGTDAGLAWDELAGDWAADAPGPPALRAAFTAEPLWVDLSDLRLDGRKSRIPADRAAAVVAPIRGMPKDMLVGEHLRQHRRTMRLAGAVIAVLAMLTAVAVTASFIAVGQRNTAIRQRDQAIADQITVVAGQLAATRPSLAAQLDVAANRASSTPDNETRLLNTTTAPLYSLVTGNQNATGSVALSATMKMVAGGDGASTVWLRSLADPSRSEPPLTRPASLPEPGVTATVESVAFGPGEKLLAAGRTDHTVWLWSSPTEAARSSSVSPAR